MHTYPHTTFLLTHSIPRKGVSHQLSRNAVSMQWPMRACIASGTRGGGGGPGRSLASMHGHALQCCKLGAELPAVLLSRMRAPVPVGRAHREASARSLSIMDCFAAALLLHRPLSVHVKKLTLKGDAAHVARVGNNTGSERSRHGASLPPVMLEA